MRWRALEDRKAGQLVYERQRESTAADGWNQRGGVQEAVAKEEEL